MHITWLIRRRRGVVILCNKLLSFIAKIINQLPVSFWTAGVKRKSAPANTGMNPATHLFHWMTILHHLLEHTSSFIFQLLRGELGQIRIVDILQNLSKLINLIIVLAKAMFQLPLFFGSPFMTVCTSLNSKCKEA